MNRGLYAGLPRTTARMRGLQVDGQTGATAVGDQTGQLVSTNTYIGYQAGQNTVQQAGTTSGTGAGLYDTFIGYQAGQANVAFDSCVCIGHQSVALASGVVAIGYKASAGGGSNPAVAIGNLASVGGNGVAIGSQTSLPVGTSASVAVGANAFATANSIAIGSSASVPSGNTGNIAIGLNANGGTVGGTTSLGANAGRSLTSGVNTFIGYNAGYSPGTLGTTYATTTGTGQTCIGYQTGQAVVSATAPGYITCLGYETTVGASGGVAIGTDHTGAAATTSTQDAFQLGTSNHTIISSGKVKMGAHGITSGALSTVTLSSGTGAQVDTTCDRNLAVVISITLATDTVAFALSPDNTTYTTLGTLTPGVAASSALYTIPVPAAWYVKATVTGSASITSGSVYY